MSAVTASLCFTSLFVGVFVLVSAEQKNIITAESGQNVTLTCRAPINNNKIIVVEWRKVDLQTKELLLYRYDHFASANQHPSFKNRVELQDRQMKDGHVSLILKNVTTADEGKYECHINMEGARSWEHTIITLRVVPPDQKTIAADPGQNVALRCQIPNNTKMMIVEWSKADLQTEDLLFYRNGQSVPGYQHPSFKNRVELQDRQMKDGDASVILKDVTTADEGTYNCRAYMRGAHHRKTDVNPINTIYLRVYPPEQEIITADPGENVTLTCRAPINNNKIIVVEWCRVDLQTKDVLLYRYDQFAPAKQHSSFKNRVDLQYRQMKDGDVSVILKDVMISDTGTYECHVFMEGARSCSLSSIIYLRVVPPDKNTIIADPGQDITLKCHVPNNIRSVEWQKADLGDEYVLLYQDDHFDPGNQHPSFKNRVDLQDRQMKDGDASLILKDVTVNDTGTYKCHVIEEGTRRRKRSVDPINTVYLRVVPPEQKTITAVPGQNVTLTCRAPNSNIKKVVKWSRTDLHPEYVLLYRDGHFIPDYQHPSFKKRVELQDRQMKDGDVSLILKDVTTADDGTYECRVFIRETRSWKIISIIYLRVDPPGQPGGLREDGSAGLSASLVVVVLVPVLVLVLAVLGFVIYKTAPQNIKKGILLERD